MAVDFGFVTLRPESPSIRFGSFCTEEYLLACMLAHSRRYQVVMATHWLSRTRGAEMEASFGPFAGTAASAPHHFGCSFWFRVVADS